MDVDAKLYTERRKPARSWEKESNFGHNLFWCFLLPETSSNILHHLLAQTKCIISAESFSSRVFFLERNYAAPKTEIAFFKITSEEWLFSRVVDD